MSHNGLECYPNHFSHLHHPQFNKFQQNSQIHSSSLLIYISSRACQSHLFYVSYYLLKPNIMTTSTPSFYPTCPNSTNTFYVCDFGSRFLGCCDFDSTAHVCNDGCANVLPASFEAQYYNDVTKNDCSDGSEWYTCEFTTPTFFGCCRSNACDSDNGCPSENLTSAILSTDATAKAPWYPIASETSSTSSHRYTVGAVAGGVIGGVVCGFLLTFLVGEILFYHRRKALRSKETGSDKRDKAEGTILV